MEKLIKDYEIELVEAGCAPGSGRWGVQLNLSDDISAVFPYFNAVMDNARYDHQNQVLVFREKGRAYAFRPHEIRIGRVRDRVEAQSIAAEAVEEVNHTWQERDSITPRFTERKIPSVMDILRLLPMTNCKQCGYPACMAFAVDLSKGIARLEDCLPLAQAEFDENRVKILDIISLD